MSTLPDLRTRDAIQSYLRGLAAELGVSLGDPRLAAELDKRDKLAEFRSKFHVPIISDFLEEGDRAEGGQLMWLCPNPRGRAANVAVSLSGRQRYRGRGQCQMKACVCILQTVDLRKYFNKI